MIVSNQLRKGSCVKLHDEVAYVSQILWNRVEVAITRDGTQQYKEASYEHLEPIPITVEIIESFGWIRHERFPHRDVFHSKKGDFIINLLKGSSELSFGLNGNFCIICNHYLNVHEIQNIYFALTNQELDVRL